MQKSKFVITAAALASCTMLSLLGLSQNTVQMLGVRPIVLQNYTIDYTKENNFSQFMVQNSSLNQILGAYQPSWFYSFSHLGTAASVYLVPKKQFLDHETLKVRSKSGT